MATFQSFEEIEAWQKARELTREIYPVPQNAPHVSAGMNVVRCPEGQRPKATDVSPWYGVYSISSQGSFSKDFGLRDQIRDASVSIMSNIAEGFERSGTKEFVQFLAIAKGSSGEVRSQLYVALDQRYITQETFDRLYSLANETGRIIGGLINYLRKSRIKGSKYK